MSYPTAYTRQYDFQGYQNANPTRPLPGDKVNTDLNAVVASIGEVVDFIEGIARSDGALTNGIVTVDALSDAVKALIGDADVLATLQTQFNAVDANVALTAADAVSTAADAASTAADVVLTHADAASTAADAISTAADAVSTAADAASTATDAISTAADAATATTQAGLAQTAATAAAASLDYFDDRYLGSFASNPTLDNDGNALLMGALYWNTASGLKVYDGATWQAYSATGIGNVVEDTTPQLGGDLDANSHTITGLAASDTASGIVELATSAETITGADTVRAVTPAGLAATSAPLAGNKNLTGGFTATSYPGGTVTGSNQTYTPSALNGGFQHITLNGSSLTGTMTLAPPASPSTIVLEIANGGTGSVGATWTTSGFTKVTGDTYAATNGNKYIAFIVKTNSCSHLHLQALQ